MIDLSVAIPVVTTGVAVGGLIFAALKFNREDAGKVVSQQSAVLADMKLLNEQLHADLARTLIERDALLKKVSEYDIRIERLTGEIAELQHKIRDLELRMSTRDE